MRSSNQFGRAAEFCVNAGSGYLCSGFAAPHQGPGVGIRPGASLYGQGFSGEHRLIELDGSIDNVHIRRNHTTQRQLYQIATHQLLG